MSRFVIPAVADVIRMTLGPGAVLLSDYNRGSITLALIISFCGILLENVSCYYLRVSYSRVLGGLSNMR